LKDISFAAKHAGVPPVKKWNNISCLTLASSGFEAQISPLGAELVRLRDEAGRDLLWNGDPAFWTGRSPLLFPIVSRLKDDRTVVSGLGHSLKQHGFARTSPFDIVEAGPDSCRLRLRSSPLTFEQYPFDFELDVTYRAEGPKLAIEATVLWRRPGGARDPVRAD
jgi:galactose mutarotase-like enzyme